MGRGRKTSQQGHVMDDLDLNLNDFPILFYGHRHGLYSCFSNFYGAPLALGNKAFACSEQAYMYGKSSNPSYQQAVLSTPNPSEVKRLGRAATLRPNWDVDKYAWMVVVLKAKFSQNPNPGAILLSTGDRAIHENCADEWWGGGPNYPTGRDLLGKALREVRAWLREPGDKEADLQAEAATLEEIWSCQL